MVLGDHVLTNHYRTLNRKCALHRSVQLLEKLGKQKQQVTAAACKSLNGLARAVFIRFPTFFSKSAYDDFGAFLLIFHRFILFFSTKLNFANENITFLQLTIHRFSANTQSARHRESHPQIS